MDQNIQKALWLGIGVLFFGAVVSIGMFVFGKGQAIAKSSSQQLDSVNKQLASVEYTGYDNEVVLGGDVLNKIEQMKDRTGEVIFLVDSVAYISTGTLTSGVVGALTDLTMTVINTSIVDAKDPSSDTYINPTSRYLSQYIYDGNGNVRGLTFTLQ